VQGEQRREVVVVVFRPVITKRPNQINPRFYSRLIDHRPDLLMPKRPHSPALDSVLSIKHAHTKHVDRPNRPLIQNFDSILSDETVLTIFGYLDPHHLCLAQAVNRHWGRLATDNHVSSYLILQALGVLIFASFGG
jgi:hypothetical protein